MESLPKRTNLISETAAALKEWISTGVLGGTLPGELPLKTRLRVGRDTLRLALKRLEQEGWITPASQGRQRQVQKERAAAAPNPTQRHLPVTVLSPHRTVDRIVLLEMEDLQKRLAETGRELQFISPDIFHVKKPDRHLRRLVEENPSAAWILYSVGEAAERWFEQEKVPAFVYGTPFLDVNLPCVANDWESAAFHAGVQLVRLGHGVIGLLQSEELAPRVLAAKRGLRRALDTASPRGRLLMFLEDNTPQGVARTLETAFEIKNRPTALVLTSTAQLLTCLSWMVSRGIGVPADVSLVCISSDTWLQELHPPVCHYENDSKRFAYQLRQRVMELVETGQITRKSVLVRLEYAAGATLGPVPWRPGQEVLGGGLHSV
jgi:DNA-binding LacI/PurR family transcriptional regulator